MSLLLGEDGSGPVELPVDTLKRHVVVLGASGSGKTVLSKCIVEEAVRAGIPCILVDPQGDLASLGIPLKGETCREVNDRMEVRIYTPASSKGIPLSCNPLKAVPAGGDAEETIRALDFMASTISSLLGNDPGSEQGKGAKALIYTVLESAHGSGSFPRELDSLAALVEAYRGSLVDASTRRSLSRGLRYMGIGVNSLIFSYGVPMGMREFMHPVRPERVPVNVIYLNTLGSDEHKQFFVSMVANEVYSWMLRNPSKRVQVVFYIDEVAVYLPPHPRNPPAKAVLKLLFKQGRKYGVSCIMSTQNPADIDYKAMAQAGTWALGRMMAKQDIARVRHIIRSLGGDHKAVVGTLPVLSAGEFVLLSPDTAGVPRRFRVRRLHTEHRTLDEDELGPAMERGVVEAYLSRLGEGPPPVQEGVGRAEPSAERGAPPRGRGMPRPVHIAETRIDRADAERKAGGIFAHVVDVSEVLIPVWQVEVRTRSGLLERLLAPGKKVENVYVHASSGKIMMISRRVEFADIVPSSPKAFKDFDEYATFLPSERDDLPPPEMSGEEARRIVRLTFDVECERVALTYLPAWRVRLSSGEERLIDAVLGKEVHE